MRSNIRILQACNTWQNMVTVRPNKTVSQSSEMINELKDLKVISPGKNIRKVRSKKSSLKTEDSLFIPKNFETAFQPPISHTSYPSPKAVPVNIKESNALTSEKKVQDPEDNKETRVNEINVQMLSQSLYRQIFGISERTNEVDSETIAAIKKELHTFGINVDDATRLPDVNIKLPRLEGKDIEEHFYNIAQQQIDPYLEIIKELLNSLPPMPKEWIFREGWTRYTENGAEPVDYPLETGMIFDIEVCVKESPLPALATAVTDKAWYGWVSKSVINGKNMLQKGQAISPDLMIPIESTQEETGSELNSFQKKPKIVVGHNVSFDRARIKEQYWLHSTGTRFLDTMSMHISVSGISSYQRAIMESRKKAKENDNENENEEIDHLNQYTSEPDWTSYASSNSLAETLKLYSGLTLQKETRDVFVKGRYANIKKDFLNLMTYCAHDVVATHSVLLKLYPLFRERFPHPVTLAGTLELGSAYLPVNSNWKKYLEEAESTYDDLNYEHKFILAKKADAACRLLHNNKYQEDLWMWSEDWAVRDLHLLKRIIRVRKKDSCATTKNSDSSEEIREEANEKAAENSSTVPALLEVEEKDIDPEKLKEEFAHVENTELLLPKKPPHMPGYPAWYTKLCYRYTDPAWVPGPQKLSTSMKIVPKLLKLTWNNYPLHHIKDHGWGILVPFKLKSEEPTKVPLKQLVEHCIKVNTAKPSSTDYDMSRLTKDVEDHLPKTEFWRYKKTKQQPIVVDDCCYFIKLPHPGGGNGNVGNPLSKEFLSRFQDNVLSGADETATIVLKIAKLLSYWRNNRDRIMSQLVAWHSDDYLSNIFADGKHMCYGAIVPGIIVSGTLTRRAVERTWLTASNSRSDRIGSELRGMVQAPPGYHIVGADVDSQELWIASLLGDANTKKIHGCTPFGWMTLIGTKANATDMHSVTAKAVGISRDHAKVINYARIYGAGIKFAEQLLQQFNPTMTVSQAQQKSRKMFTMTKGKKVYKLKSEYALSSLWKDYNSYEAYSFAKAHNKRIEEMFHHPDWVGGSESEMFNRLEQIARSRKPITPFLESRLTRGLELIKDESKYLPTKVNWVVQSGAVDFLHLMLVSMRWLMKDNARFCLSFHDEVRYLVPSVYRYNAALAMHVTNLLTRAFCASKVGIKDLPQSVAFFSSVEVDTVLRKDANNDCVTPSNPRGLKNGYGIPPGESLDIDATLQKSYGSLGPWHNDRQQ